MNLEIMQVVVFAAAAAAAVVVVAVVLQRIAFVGILSIYLC